MVMGLVTEGARVVGVRIKRSDGVEGIRGREVVISAGALHSPRCCCAPASGRGRISRASAFP